MDVQEQIDKYIADQPEPKRDEMQELHHLVLNISPKCKLWFLDGRDSENRIVSNPNIGYGLQIIKSAGKTTRKFYKVGLSANATGISIYIVGIEDRKYLTETYGERLGKASVTGYCIKFKTLRDMNIEALEDVIRFGLER